MNLIDKTNNSTLNIIHFNDVYNISGQTVRDKIRNNKEIIGGASKFKSF